MTSQQNRSGQGGALTGEDLIQNARASEECRDYNKAIDSYLSVNPENCNEQTVVMNSFY